MKTNSYHETIVPIDTCTFTNASPGCTNHFTKNAREFIFNKAGMTHSGFDYKNLQSPYKTVGYDIFSDSVHIRSRIADSSAAYAAGGIYSTVGDMFRFHQALLANKIK